MVPRDRIVVQRYQTEPDGAGGRKKVGNPIELLNCLAEVKELKATNKLENLQARLNQVIQVKFWKRANVELLAGDVLIWKDANYILQGADIAEDFRNVVRVVMAVGQ